MRFYEIICSERTKYKNLYSNLELIGNFCASESLIIFHTNKTNKKIMNMFEDCNVSIIEINPEKYLTKNSNINEWVSNEYRVQKVEKLLKKAEKEKQNELKKLYGVIKSAEDIIIGEEDLIDEETE